MSGWQQQAPHPGFPPPEAQQGFIPPGHQPPPQAGFEGYPHGAPPGHPAQPQMMGHPHMEGHYPPPPPPQGHEMHHQQQAAAQQQQQQPTGHPHQMPMSNWFEPM